LITDQSQISILITCMVARFCREIEHVLSDSRIWRQKTSAPDCMTDAPETDASFLAPVSGAGFWSVCHWHKFLIVVLDLSTTSKLCTKMVYVSSVNMKFR